MRNILFILIALFLFACKSAKHVSDSGPLILKKDSVTLLINQPFIRTANFSSVNLQIQVQQNSFSSKAIMKIVADSAIQISFLPALGIEVARVQLFTDSFYLVNKMNNIYYADSYAVIKQKLGLSLSFNDLQSVLCNQLFLMGEPKLDRDSVSGRFKISDFPDGKLITANSRANKYRHEYILDKQSQISALSINSAQQLFKVNYLFFTNYNSTIYPSQLKFSLTNGPKMDQVIMQVGQVIFNEPVTIQRMDLSAYTRVFTLEQIIPQ